MRLYRYGAPKSEKPAAVDAEGNLRDLSGKIDDLGPSELAPTPCGNSCVWISPGCRSSTNPYA